MKRTPLAAVLIIAFSAIAVFGIFGMSHGGHGHGGCLAAAASGAGCPRAEGPISVLNFHIKTFRDFSTAVWSNGSARALLIAFALLLLFVAAASAGEPCRSLSADGEPAVFRQCSESDIATCQRRFTRWLAFHEHSPSAV